VGTAHRVARAAVRVVHPLRVVIVVGMVVATVEGDLRVMIGRRARRFGTHRDQRRFRHRCAEAQRKRERQHPEQAALGGEIPRQAVAEREEPHLQAFYKKR